MRALIDLWRDVVIAARGIRRAPIAAAVVVVSLGAGIGVNTVVFSWLDAAVLRPLPGVENAASLLLIEPRRADGSYTDMSWRQYRDYRRRLVSVADLLSFRMTALYVGEPASTERMYGLMVSEDYFSALGLRPAAGRFLVPDEASTPARGSVVVVSYDYGRTRYGNAADAIGSRIRVDGALLTIIGVAPRGFEGTIPRLKFDLFLPATLAPVLRPGSQELDDRAEGAYSVVAVLRKGVSRRAATDAVHAAAAEFARDFPKTDAGLTAEVLSYWEAPRGPQKFMADAIVAVQGVLLLMLLSVCANTANLMLARTLSRQREIGVRMALGASRRRIAALVFVDALLLALAGAGAGAVFAWWGTDALRAMPPLHVRGLPVSFETHVSPLAVAFAGALGIVCAVLFAAPAVLQFARADPALVLKSSSLRISPNRIRSAITGVQIALAVFVLIAGGLALEGFLETRTATTGFRTNGVLLASYDLTGPGAPADARDFAVRVLREIRTEAAAEGAAIATSVPLDIHGLPTRPFAVEGYVGVAAGDDEALTNTVTPGYFALLDIPFVEGTDFVPLEDRSAPPQAIVNDAFVRAYLPGLNAIGRNLTSRGRVYRISGVVRTSLSDSFGEPPLPAIYLSFRDVPPRFGEIHVRTRQGNDTAVAGGVRRAVQRVSPGLPIFDVRTMTEHIESNLLFRRIPARLFVVIAPILAGLVGIGIYALVAYTASRRHREILVRLAIGAPPQRIVRTLVGDTLRVVAAGAVTGLVAAVIALASGAVLSRQQAVVFAIVPIVVALLGVASAVVPAVRALVQPSWEALREE